MATEPVQSRRRWYRRSWFKILTFVFLTPVWILIVWLDPDEKRSIKVFAGVILALIVGYQVVEYFGPDARVRRQISRDWPMASPGARLDMLLAGIEEPSVLDFLFHSTREEVRSTLGPPAQTNAAGEFVYYAGPTSQGQGRATLTLRFGDDGRVRGMSAVGKAAGPTR